MMEKKYKILTTYWFISGLAILLLNDFIFKEMYPNWITGKVSDFAGLFIFPLFWTAIFPNQKKIIYLTTIVFFIYWKSPYSQSLIDSWNYLGLIELARVVDYSDLLALVILPLSYFIENKPVKVIRLNPAIPIVIASFAFIATSRGRTEVELNRTYLIDSSKASLITAAQELDSVEVLSYTINAEQNPDTINLNIQSALCDREMEIDISFAELNTGKTLVTILNIIHDCSLDDTQKEALKIELERLIINRLKTKT